MLVLVNLFYLQPTKKTTKMKNLTFLFPALLSLSICFYSCSDDDAPDPEPDPVDVELTIIPGQGINNLKIGDLGSKVQTELGDDYQPVINVGGSGNATYNYFNASEGLDIIFGQQNSGDLDINTLPIQSFYLFDDFDGMTAEGIKIGSTKAEVEAAYGEPDEVDMWANVYYIGMLISYDDMDLVQNITILEI